MSLIAEVARHRLWRILSGREVALSNAARAPLRGRLRYGSLMVVLLAIGFVAGTLVVSADPVFSQEKSLPEEKSSADELALPEGIPPLPDVAKGAPVLINSANVNTWKALVVPELLESVKSGAVTLAARSKLGYFWRIDDEWESQSYKNFSANRLALVGGSTMLRAEIALNSAYPFGGEAEILTESTPDLLGARVLWNAQSVWWGQGSLDTEFDLTWLKDGRPVRALNGEFIRAYPALLGMEGGAQVFRERLTVNGPEVIRDLGWLTYRFRGGDEDVVWFYSPALRKARQLTGSNRSDAIARGVTAMDDLLVWSGKAEAVDATADRSAVGLTPFASTAFGQLSPAGEACFEVNLGTGGDEGTMAQISAALDDASSVIGNAVFVPRRLWRVELTSGDPYSLYGRQVLYVDKGSMLPIYKFVYDRSGHLWKTVIGIFGLGTTADRKTKRPYAAGQLVIDHRKDETNVLRFSRFASCRRPTAQFAPANFDPRKLWPQPTPVPEKKGKK